jgi:hypothetical protein
MAVGIALLVGCGRTEMEMPVRVAGSGGSDTSTGGTGGAASGPCGEATCLTSLFQTCVPEGSCSSQGGNSPNAAYGTACYANGVTVSTVGGWNGSNVFGSLMVRRNGALCYSIDTSSPPNVSAITYVVSGADGEEVATGTTADKSGTVPMACKGSQPTPVAAACLHPVGDDSACNSGTCP